MRFSLFALPALAVFSAAAPTTTGNEIAKRGSGSPLADMITDLTTQVKGFAAHMTQITGALPADASEDDKKTAAASVIKDIEGITTAFQTTNTQLQAVKKPIQARQDLSDLPDDVLGQLNGQPIVFARLLNTLLTELNPALQSVLVTLSLGMFFVAGWSSFARANITPRRVLRRSSASPHRPAPRSPYQCRQLGQRTPHRSRTSPFWPWWTPRSSPPWIGIVSSQQSGRISFVVK